jgi:hypothetical protein
MSVFELKEFNDNDLLILYYGATAGKIKADSLAYSEFMEVVAEIENRHLEVA